MKLTPEQQESVAARLDTLLSERKAIRAAGPRNKRELAEALGVARQTLQPYLDGARPLSTGGDSAVTLEKIAEAMDVKPLILLS